MQMMQLPFADTAKAIDCREHPHHLRLQLPLTQTETPEPSPGLRARPYRGLEGLMDQLIMLQYRPSSRSTCRPVRFLQFMELSVRDISRGLAFGDSANDRAHMKGWSS